MAGLFRDDFATGENGFVGRGCPPHVRQSICRHSADTAVCQAIVDFKK